ncbi:gluconate 2-dehydrogenase subunit 3 family protein [Marinoscillum furvescens]|uniref:Gluconate 2-dehydrogenase subunit 3-like protein n=1 Tax=Marinoscillum furvescens DSM 4134 TaxID=1122208 RepID=A0A3D9KZI9_MARFU|nr:gluconate 2-dehydrogenase subunit 3 family protein [Marinoscillum furvescens]RED93378.1 gluconate 2-dehydrogenase subunit 3-like protein [Marinoscillum furvescens DSM 4134]
MKRREALQSLGVLFGGTIVGAQAFLSGCSTEAPPVSGILNDRKIKLLNDLGETLLPTTADSPGARQVDVGNFINDIVSAFYTPEEQQIFLDGLKAVTDLCDKQFSKTYDQLSPEEQTNLCLQLEAAAKAHRAAVDRGEKSGEHYYVMIKQLTIWGYLSSEEVAKTAFKHMPVPGKYEGCIDYTPGDKAIFQETGRGASYWYAVKSI